MKSQINTIVITIVMAIIILRIVIAPVIIIPIKKIQEHANVLIEQCNSTAV